MKKFLKKYGNMIGWLGAIASLAAYFSVSFGLLHPRDLSYQLLNLGGAVGLGTICYFRRTYQPFVVNLIWGAIAVLAILNIIFAFH